MKHERVRGFWGYGFRTVFRDPGNYVGHHRRRIWMNKQIVVATYGNCEIRQEIRINVA